jgi:hypothetical protein
MIASVEELSLKALPGKPAVVPDRVMHEEHNAQLTSAAAGANL